jgi:hypothetical protein
VATLASAGALLVFFVLFTQFLVWHYGRAVLRSAVFEAARAQAPLGAPNGSCEQRFLEVRSGLLAGSLGDGVGSITCVVSDGLVLASVDVRFERWLPISPDWEFTVEAVAIREKAPE